MKRILEPYYDQLTTCRSMSASEILNDIHTLMDGASPIIQVVQENSHRSIVAMGHAAYKKLKGMNLAEQFKNVIPLIVKYHDLHGVVKHISIKDIKEYLGCKTHIVHDKDELLDDLALFFISIYFLFESIVKNQGRNTMIQISAALKALGEVDMEEQFKYMPLLLNKYQSLAA